MPKSESNQKHQIEAALKGFASQPLADAATALFASLGYDSKKRLVFSTLNAFLSEFAASDKIKALIRGTSARRAESQVLLTQITTDEITAASDGQLQLFTDKKPDLRLFDSYLFLAIDLPQANLSRLDLAERARAINQLFSQPVLVLFRYGEYVSIGITYRRANKRDQPRDVIDRKVTLIKDIRFAVPHRAHQDILADFSLAKLSTSASPIRTFAQLDDAWRKALNTQELNRRFYGELSAWYYWAVTTIRLPVVADHLKDRDDAEEENVRQFTIRLLCRTIFCWFIKERGLIDRRLLELSDETGQPAVLVRRSKAEKAFEKENSYYRGILQNIFFNCLNKPMDQRRLTSARAATDKTTKNPEHKKLAYRGKHYLPDDFDYTLFDRIPYLNGGLFDNLPEDNASDSIEDGAIRVPNELFYCAEKNVTHDKRTVTVKGLNRILDSYKFTIAENTPLEEEIALDPELLGLVFENLLAEVDTNDINAVKSARRASGSFYTPRRVIDYMVNESLRLHLENFICARGATPDDCYALTDLLYHDHFEEHQQLARWIVEAFDEIRILDPACGSGAFPMGALHRMVSILQKVDPKNKRWLNRQVSHIPDRHLRETAETELARHADDYSRKLGLIKNAIYGVDIQPLAVLITKLRFFISLLVDQNITLDDAANNYGLTPLPNLETKVLCANTLREVQVSLFERAAIRKYQSARDEYYQPETSAIRRDELTENIAAALSELLPSFAEEVTGQKKYKDRRSQELRNRELLKEWFRHSTLPAPFFNFAVFFPEICSDMPAVTVGGELPLVNEAQAQQELVVPGRKMPAHPRSGFDIVIGNPPYGGTDISSDVREALGLKCNDPYGAFIARFMRDGKQSTPLRIGGVLAYIVSDTFMTIKTHMPLREQLMGSRIHKMIRVKKDTFTATVNTAIILLQKGGGPGTKPPTDTALAETWEKGPWCQMVDLTQVSIHSEHDRFLQLLENISGGDRRRDVATESCAVYHYPQSLIATNTNLPFFVASPKLFRLMNDTTAPVIHAMVGGKSVSAREVSVNARQSLVFKLGAVAHVPQGISTGQNDHYLRRRIAGEGYEQVDTSRILTETEYTNLTRDEQLNGVNPSDYEGRHFIPFDKGSETDTDSNWLSNYYVPTDYYIDWSQASLQRMRSLTIANRKNECGEKQTIKVGDDAKLAAALRNQEQWFQPVISFSPTGHYSPTFRLGVGTVSQNTSSGIIVLEIPQPLLLGVLASALARYFFKNYLNHTVHTQEGDVTEFPFIHPKTAETVNIARMVESIVDKQKTIPRYDYASNEQLEIDKLVYEAYGLNHDDIAEVETWYARRYDKLAVAQRRNLRNAGKMPNVDRWCVYCDESGHLAYDHVSQMVLGALLIPRERVRPLTLKLRERLSALGWPAKRELKWTKVSQSGLKFYETALDFFLREPDLRFRALIAPKSSPPAKLPPIPTSDDPESAEWENYQQVLEETAPAAVDHLHSHEVWYYDRYFDLLRDTLLPPAHHSIFVDVKDTRGGTRIRALEERLSDAHYDWTRSGIVEGVSQIASHEVLLDQLVDLLLGCVAWTHGIPVRNAGHAPNAGKSALAAKFVTALQQANGELVPKIVIDRSVERSPTV